MFRPLQRGYSAVPRIKVLRLGVVREHLGRIFTEVEQALRLDGDLPGHAIGTDNTCRIE